MDKESILKRYQEIRLTLRENMVFWKKEMQRSNDLQTKENYNLYKKDLRLLDIEIERIKQKR